MEALDLKGILNSLTEEITVHVRQPWQRSKLTFLKSRLLATFNCKMVAIKKKSVAKNKKT